MIWYFMVLNYRKTPIFNLHKWIFDNFDNNLFLYQMGNKNVMSLRENTNLVFNDAEEWM